MEKNIDFSIVIVNYNMGKYLEDALLSIIRQDYPKESRQIIVIDGKSTDNSTSIIKKYQDDIDYWISEPDKGQSDAFNKGFEKAKNTWLFWLNADDFLMIDALKKISNSMHKALRKDGNLRWFCFDNLMTNEEGICQRAIYGPDWNNFFMRHLGPIVHSATTIFHKELYNKSGKFDLNLNWSMDLDLWVQFFKMGFYYKTIHVFAYSIRINQQSKTFSQGLTFKPSEKRKQQSAYMWKKNKFIPNRKFLFPWRLYKAFTILIPLIFYNIYYRNKEVVWWK